jgi:hypothetical protein
MKAKNLTLYSTDQALLDRWYEEYESLGRNVRRFRDKVVVYAYPKKKPQKPKHPAKGKKEAPKTHERAEQRSKRERWYE